jgi:hypothetical protein
MADEMGSGYDSDRNLLHDEEERDFNGFLVPPRSSPASAELGSPASAASSAFGSSGSAASGGLNMLNKCTRHITNPHKLITRNTCRGCFKEHNEERTAQGLGPGPFGVFCKHGINKFTTNKCTDPECMAIARRDYVKKNLSLTPFLTGDPKAGLINRFGEESPFAPVLPGETRVGLTHVPAREADVLQQDFSGVFNPNHESTDSGFSMGGGRKSYRKSYRSLNKKARKSSRKAKRSSRKAKRSSRKAKRSSRKAKRS